MGLVAPQHVGSSRTKDRTLHQQVDSKPLDHQESPKAEFVGSTALQTSWCGLLPFPSHLLCVKFLFQWESGDGRETCAVVTPANWKPVAVVGVLE